MRKALAVLAVVVSSLAVPKAFAYDCVNRYQLMIGPGTWWEYVGNPLNSSASDCWTLGTNGPSWDSSSGYWQFTYWQDTTSTATRVINVPSTDSGTSSWSAQFVVDFNDPHANWYDALFATVDVNHGGSHTLYSFYNNIASSGLTTDSGTKSVNFSAVSGDTISVTIQGRDGWYPDARVRFAEVHVFRQG